MKTPILLLVFNRLDTTKEVMKILAKVKPTSLFVAGDGPREGRPEEKKAVEAVRQYVLGNISWECQVTTLFRDSNLGCGLGVSSAITWFFERVDYGIILEDDCLPDTSFFEYCTELLQRYASNEKVMSISGTHFGAPAAIDTDYYFSNYPLMWGWATWKRSWDKYEFVQSDWKSILNNKHGLSLRSRLYWQKIFSNLQHGTIDTWDYQWILTVWRNQGVVCRPKVNLVKNIGFGPGATHTYLEENPASSLVANKLSLPLIHPSNYRIYYDGDRAAEKIWINLSFKSFMGLYFPLFSAFLKRFFR